MKKYLTIICLVQIGLLPSLPAQDYEPLVRDNAHWVVGHRHDGLGICTEFMEYFTEGDSILNDVLYKKVYQYQLESVEYEPPYTRTGSPVLYGFLREDTIGRIVYGILINPINPYECFATEDTLFNFAVSQTDTLELCIGNAGPITFDAIYYVNAFGYYRKHFKTKDLSNYAGIHLIEGIGSDNGLFEWLGFAFKDFDGYVLKCYTQGDISNCSILTNTEKVVAPRIIKIFPNPLIGNMLTIEIPGNNNPRLILQVIDVYGKVLSESIIETSTYNLDLGGLSKGVYVIKVLKENQELLINKILKI
ncbi:MAG: T9SS type A sorting domain-containing protein [Bacteroidales bacterium]|nr:T9SS type A sorting domain-containing protein [Bacteroidales bacterium]